MNLNQINSNNQHPQIKLILLLGSYDEETKNLLNIIKDEISKISTFFTEINVLTLLLEDVELYIANTNQIIIEKYDEKATFILISGFEIISIEDYSIKSEEDINNIIKKLGFKSFIKVPILEKLKMLAYATSLIFVIRHLELTRGGEYIELTFLLGKGLNPRKVYMLINKNIEISTMLKELIDNTKINLRTYKDKTELLDTIRRITYYEVLKK